MPISSILTQVCTIQLLSHDHSSPKHIGVLSHLTWITLNIMLTAPAERPVNLWGSKWLTWAVSSPLWLRGTRGSPRACLQGCCPWRPLYTPPGTDLLRWTSVRSWRFPSLWERIHWGQEHQSGRIPLIVMLVTTDWSPYAFCRHKTPSKLLKNWHITNVSRTFNK